MFRYVYVVHIQEFSKKTFQCQPQMALICHPVHVLYDLPGTQASMQIMLIMEELVAKENTKSLVWDYLGFNRVEPTSKGWCLNSQLFWRY